MNAKQVRMRFCCIRNAVEYGKIRTSKLHTNVAFRNSLAITQLETRWLKKIKLLVTVGGCCCCCCCCGCCCFLKRQQQESTFTTQNTFTSHRFQLIEWYLNFSGFAANSALDFAFDLRSDVNSWAFRRSKEWCQWCKVFGDSFDMCCCAQHRGRPRWSLPPFNAVTP